MELNEILSRCDHTLLSVTATSEEIKALCDEAIEYGCASVCIPACHVRGAKAYVGEQMKICTVIGFPNGYCTTEAKAFMAADAVKNGADEIDMVANLCMARDGHWDGVLEDIKAVRRATEGKVLKVIIECCLLTEEEKLEMCECRHRRRRGLHQDQHRLLHRRGHARGRRAPARPRRPPTSRSRPPAA